MVKCIILGKAQRRLAHGYVCWASDGFSHCISCGGNAALSNVTHLHLLFLRQPKGSMEELGKGVGNLFQMPRLGFFFSVHIFDLLEILSMNVVCNISEYKSALFEFFHY